MFSNDIFQIEKKANCDVYKIKEKPLYNACICAFRYLTDHPTTSAWKV